MKVFSRRSCAEAGSPPVTASAILAVVTAALVVSTLAGLTAEGRADDRVSAVLVAASELELHVPTARSLVLDAEAVRLVDGERLAGGRSWHVTVDARRIAVPVTVRVGDDGDGDLVEVTMVALVARVEPIDPRAPGASTVELTRLVAPDAGASSGPDGPDEGEGDA
jgi:hypothetical protein